MSIKRFHYSVEGRFNFMPPLGTKDKNDLAYLGSEDWKSGERKGRFDKYLISPGFYVELFEGKNEISTADIVGEEAKEPEFRGDLENRLNVKLRLIQ